MFTQTAASTSQQAATAAFYIFMLEQLGETFRKQTREALDFLMDPTDKIPDDTTMKIIDSIFLMGKAENLENMA